MARNRAKIKRVVKLFHLTMIGFTTLYYVRAMELGDARTGGYSIFLCFFLRYATLFDACFLAGEAAEIVKLGTTYLTIFVDGDRVDEG